MTKEFIGVAPRQYGDPVDFRITITNTGGTVITLLPLTDIYPLTYLRFVSAEPAADNTNDDGELTWADLTVVSGDIAPGSSIEVLVHFELKSFPPSGEPIENMAFIESGQDQYGALVTADDTVDLTPDPGCADLYVNSFEIVIEPKADAPAGRTVLIISAPVWNRGPFTVVSGSVYFAYEATPLDPSDDPNLNLIAVDTIGPVAMGAFAAASVEWDVTGYQQVDTPLYILPAANDYGECALDFAQSDVTVPVRLAEFSAEPGDGRVRLNWITETEVNHLGFRLYRSENFFAAREQIGPALIPGAGGASFGRRSYEYFDEDARNGTPFFYWLAMVDTAGREQMSPVASAVPQSRTPAISLVLRPGRWTHATGQPCHVFARLENPGAALDGDIYLLWARRGGRAEFLLEGIPAVIPAGLAVEGEIYQRPWTAEDPAGDYAVFLAITEPKSNKLLALGVASFGYQPPMD